MFIIESQLKQIVKEEASRVLLERELKSFILSNLTEQQKRTFLKTGTLPEELMEGVLDWLRTKGRKLAGAAALSAALMGPLSSAAQAAAPEIQAPADSGDVSTNMKRAENQIRKALAKWYTSPAPATAFMNFIKKHHAPTFDPKNFKNEEERNEAINDHYETEVALKILELIEKIEVIDVSSTTEAIPPDVAKAFKNVQVGGLYSAPKNAIYMNLKSFEATGEADIDTIMATMQEEFLHAIDGNITVGDLFQVLADKPQGDIQFGMSKSLARSAMANIIVSQEESGLDKETYDYLTNPQEFWAKMARIKMNTSADIGDNLEDILNNPLRYFKRGAVDFRIFQLLKKGEKEEINNYFKQIVKVDKKAPTSQIA